jgi:hypothetical protein
MTAIGFLGYKLYFINFGKTERYFLKQLNLLLTFAGILDTGIIYLIQISCTTYKSYHNTNDVFNGTLL